MRSTPRISFTNSFRNPVQDILEKSELNRRNWYSMWSGKTQNQLVTQGLKPLRSPFILTPLLSTPKGVKYCAPGWRQHKNSLIIRISLCGKTEIRMLYPSSNWILKNCVAENVPRISTARISLWWMSRTTLVKVNSKSRRLWK